MKPMKRAVHIDFHTMPGITDMAENFNGEKLARILSEAHVDYVNIFARCNLGFSYYPTKVGTVYPGLKRDLLGECIEACHKRNIGVTAYVNGGLNHQLLIDHPEYMKIDAEGRVYEAGDPTYNHFFRMPCFNTGYRQHLYAEVREMLEKDPDGIFVDCMLPKRVCVCPACRKKMRERGIDANDPDQVFAFTVATLREVFAELRAIVPQDKRFYINSLAFEAISKYQSHVELECLPTSKWGYDFIAAQAPYLRNFGKKDLVYMTGCMVTGWGDFGGAKSAAALEFDVYDALMYGYAPSMGDNMHPRDGLNEPLYRALGKMYEYVEALEPYTDQGVPLTEVGVLRNKLTDLEVLKPVNESDKGVTRMLSELKICYDVVNEDMDLSPYRLLILPDEIRITDQLEEKLRAFPGAILSTGRSIRKSPVWDYIDSFEPNDGTDGFYTDGGEVFGQRCPGIRMKSAYSVSDDVEPYFQKHYDGFHGYFYVPPKGSIGGSAVAKRGNRAHICFEIFKAYIACGALYHRKLIEKLFAELLPEPLIQTDLPATSRATLRRSPRGTLLFIKTTYPENWNGRGVINAHTRLPAGAKVSVRGAFREAVTLPDEKSLAARSENGRTEITLPEINGYLTILLK